jgi:hypothetical protein
MPVYEIQSGDSVDTGVEVGGMEVAVGMGRLVAVGVTGIGVGTGGLVSIAVGVSAGRLVSLTVGIDVAVGAHVVISKMSTTDIASLA